MVFLSVTVVKGSKSLLPWQIIECHSGNISIQGFFETVLLPKLHLDEETGTTEISDVFIGNTRDRLLYRAEPELTLSPVVVEFGKYMKIVVVLNELVSMNQPQSRSVLDVVRQAQQALVQPKTPSKTI